MTLRKSQRIAIKIIWICLLVLSVPFLIPYGLAVLTWYGLSGFGGSEPDSLFLLLAALPLLIMGAGTYFLLKWLRTADKEDIRQELGKEHLLPGEHDEQQVLRALEQNGELSLEELATITGMQTAQLLPIIRMLLAKTIISQTISLYRSTYHLTTTPINTT